MGFVVDAVALDQVFLVMFRFIHRQRQFHVCSIITTVCYNRLNKRRTQSQPAPLNICTSPRTWREAFENLMVEHLGKKSLDFHEACNFGLRARKIPRLHLPYQVNSSPQFHTAFLRNSFTQTQGLASYFSRQVFKLKFDECRASSMK